MEGWLLWPSCAFGWTLLALGLIDLRHLVLPDVLTLPLAAAGLVVAWFAAPDAVLDDAAGAVGGFAVFTLVAWGYRRWRGRDGLGAGDAKLLAALGAWVGRPGLPSVVLLASLAALAMALGDAVAAAGRAAVGARAVRPRAGARGVDRVALRTARPRLNRLSARRRSSAGRAARPRTRQACRSRYWPALRKAR